MRVVVSSIFVDDQDKALDFYTTKLGFVSKTDIPLGSARWLSVVAPNDREGAEPVLEPDAHPAGGVQECLGAGWYSFHFVRGGRRPG